MIVKDVRTTIIIFVQMKAKLIIEILKLIQLLVDAKNLGSYHCDSKIHHSVIAR